MLYYSLKNENYRVGFQEAVHQGIAPNKGLFFPERIPKLSPSLIKNIAQYEIHEVAFEVIYPYLKEDVEKSELLEIINRTLSFSFPVSEIYEGNLHEENIYALELFHGPTLAFKDVGAKFMAECLCFFQKKKTIPITVLVATSGDTGGAVARGFYKVPNVKVIILYPSGRISQLQEKQITTLGENISALEIDGNFDDCQNLVKYAFLDKELKKEKLLTSANSINIARWLPQMFYYFIAYRSLVYKLSNRKLIFSVPSGNFGNICAGMLATKMGLPIQHFISATNINNTIPRFMENGVYTIQPTHATISNAMDVANPSNFVRIMKLYSNLETLKKSMSAYYFTDCETLQAIQRIWNNQGYMLDPHGAIGYLGLEKYLRETRKDYTAYLGVFLETAHPVKFLDTMPQELRDKIVISNRLKNLIQKDKTSQKMSKEYKIFRTYLLDTH